MGLMGATEHMFSVVIPAHNEEAVIGRCLKALTQGLTEHDVQIIVVCNGCSDSTAQKARTYAGVSVIEIDEASKIAALNTGDTAANYYPIAYIDADVVISGTDLKVVVEELRCQPQIMVAAPKMHINTEGASPVVRAFYRVWMALPYFTSGQMVGSGIFVLSEAGRSRFGHFPKVISDDGYVRSLYKYGERVTVQNSVFEVFAPRDLENLIKIKTRVRLGNMEVAAKYPNVEIGSDNGVMDVAKLALRRPWLIFDCLIYIFVQLQTKRKSKVKFAKSNFSDWERDDSSRII